MREAVREREKGRETGKEAGRGKTAAGPGKAAGRTNKAGGSTHEGKEAAAPVSTQPASGTMSSSQVERNGSSLEDTGSTAGAAAAGATSASSALADTSTTAESAPGGPDTMYYGATTMSEDSFRATSAAQETSPTHGNSLNGNSLNGNSLQFIIRATNTELAQLSQIFGEIDKEKSGEIPVWRLQEVFERMNYPINEEELFELTSDLHDSSEQTADGMRRISYPHTVGILERIKEKKYTLMDDSDLLDAFMALGGNADKSGTISVALLKEIMDKFGLFLDEKKLLEEIDVDGSGSIDFFEFKTLIQG